MDLKEFAKLVKKYFPLGEAHIEILKDTLHIGIQTDSKFSDLSEEEKIDRYCNLMEDFFEMTNDKYDDVIFYRTHSKEIE